MAIMIAYSAVTRATVDNEQANAIEGIRDPHLSVVAVSRNDDHGGDLRGRMQHFVDGFIAQCRRHRLDAELILVEWNPPRDRPPLVEVLQWPEDFGRASVRIVTVSPEIHAQYSHSSQLPLFQMIGKNVGIRRARGRFVLATNIDILLDDATVQYLRDRLRVGTMLRIDRYDVPGGLSKGAPLDQVLAECAKTFSYVNMRLGVFDVRERRTLNQGIGKSVVDLIAASRILGLRGIGLWRSLPGAVYMATARVIGAARTMRIRGQGIAAIGRAIHRIAELRFSRLREELLRNIDSLHRLAVRAYYAIRSSIAPYLRRGPQQLARLARGIASYLTGRLGGASSATVRYHRSRWLHTNGCGDFTVLSRDDWARLRGYPEWPIFSWHLDSAFMYAAAAHDVREVALGTRYRIYHLDHAPGSGYSPSGAAQLFARLDAKHIPYLSNDDLERWRQQVAVDPQSAIVNGPDWGLGDQLLPERQVSYRFQNSLHQQLKSTLPLPVRSREWGNGQ